MPLSMRACFKKDIVLFNCTMTCNFSFLRGSCLSAWRREVELTETQLVWYDMMNTHRAVGICLNFFQCGQCNHFWQYTSLLVMEFKGFSGSISFQHFLTFYRFIAFRKQLMRENQLNGQKRKTFPVSLSHTRSTWYMTWCKTSQPAYCKYQIKPMIKSMCTKSMPCVCLNNGRWDIPGTALPGPWMNLTSLITIIVFYELVSSCLLSRQLPLLLW